MLIYRDKNGRIIEKGMFLKHNDGTVELVLSNIDEDDLGFNANNPNYKYDFPSQIYPLYQFDLSEWEIVDNI